MAKQARKKIIDAAFALFLQKGYHGVSLKDIKSQTGLSQGAIYHHFDSKHSIYLETVEEYFFNMINHDFKHTEDLSFKEQIRFRFETMIDLFTTINKMIGKNSYPIRSYFLFQLESEKDVMLRKKIELGLENYRNDLIELVQSAIHRKEIKSALAPDVIAFQLIALIEGIAIHHSTVSEDIDGFLRSKFEELIIPYIQMISDPSNETANSKVKNLTV